MAKITTLKNKQGTTLYPQTVASVVYTQNGNTVASELAQLEKSKLYLGYFDTPEALPSIGKDGQYANIGSTDTIWVWDKDTNTWKDTGNASSAVLSVNGLTGDVELTGNNIEATAGDTTKSVDSHLQTIYNEIDNIDDSKVSVSTEIAGLDLSKDITSEELRTALNVQDGAEANVNADWNATSGDAEILNKPTLGTVVDKNVSTDISSGDDIPTASQVRTYVANNGGKIDSISVNGTTRPIENKNVNIVVPTKTSDITNDSDFVTADDVSTTLSEYVLYDDIEDELRDGSANPVANDTITKALRNKEDSTYAQIEDFYERYSNPSSTPYFLDQNGDRQYITFLIGKTLTPEVQSFIYNLVAYSQEVDYTNDARFPFAQDQWCILGQFNADELWLDVLFPNMLNYSRIYFNTQTNAFEFDWFKNLEDTYTRDEADNTFALKNDLDNFISRTSNEGEFLQSEYDRTYFEKKTPLDNPNYIVYDRIPSRTLNSNGITITLNDDYTLTINGTATNDTYIQLVPEFKIVPASEADTVTNYTTTQLETGATYFYGSMYISGTGGVQGRDYSSYFSIYGYDRDIRRTMWYGNFIGEFLSTNYLNTIIASRIYIARGKSFNNYTIGGMLVKGNTQPTSFYYGSESTEIITDLPVHESQLDLYADKQEVETIKETLDEIRLFKFPNAVIVGDPTINNGQLSNFALNNYMIFPFILDVGDRNFQIDFSFTTGSDVTTQQNIMDSKFGLALAIKNGKGLMAVSANGTSWASQAVGTINILSNTTYYARLTWNRLQYKTAISTDGINYTDDMAITMATKPYPRTIYIGGGNATELGRTPNPFKGIINMNKASLYIANQLIWQGMDDVGLATRADVSLSNLDELGEKKLRDSTNAVISEKGFATETYVDNAVSGKMDKTGGTFTGDVTINGKNLLLSKGNYICPKDTTQEILGVTLSNATLLGNEAFATRIRGSETRPKYNGNDLALASDIPSGLTSIDGLAGGTLTSSLILTGGSSPTNTANIQLDNFGCLTAKGTSNVVFGRTNSGADVTVGNSAYDLKLYGSNTILTFNGLQLAYAYEIPSLNGYATQTWVKNNFLKPEDAPVQTVNGKFGEVELTAEDVGALPDTTVIPTSVNGLSGGTISSGVAVQGALSTTGNISGQYIQGTWLQTTSTTELANYTDFFVNSGGWLYKRSKENVKADLGVPTKVSDLNNDSGFITSSSISNMLTTNTAQTATAKKTFNGGIAVSSWNVSQDSSGNLVFSK